MELSPATLDQLAPVDDLWGDDFTEGEREYLEHIAFEMKIGIYWTPEILKAVQTACMYHQQPTIQQAASSFVTQLTCTCLHTIAHADRVDCVLWIWQNLQCPSECPFIVTVYEYYMTVRRFPTVPELASYIIQRSRMEDAPDEYCNDMREEVPTRGLDLLQPIKADHGNDICTVCVEKIQEGEMVFKLPQCGHVFHAEQQSCLGTDGSIVSWLRKSKFCPNCNTEIDCSPVVV